MYSSLRPGKGAHTFSRIKVDNGFEGLIRRVLPNDHDWQRISIFCLFLKYIKHSEIRRQSEIAEKTNRGIIEIRTEDQVNDASETK